MSHFKNLINLNLISVEIVIGLQNQTLSEQILFFPEFACELVFPILSFNPQNEDLCSSSIAEVFRTGIQNGEIVPAMLLLTSEILQEIDIRIC